MYINILKNIQQGAGPMAKWPKFHAPHFSSPGSQVRIPGTDLPHSSALLWRHPTYKKQGKTGTDVSSGLIFLRPKKKEDLQQMLVGVNLPHQKNKNSHPVQLRMRTQTQKSIAC